MGETRTCTERRQSPVACVALALAAPTLSFAAAPSDENIIEQIIVTAQKRATALQDVPFSVAAPTERQIRNAGASNIAELGRNVPGLAITDLGPGQSQVATPRHQRRPGRARPAGRQGVGRRLSRRVADLRGAVHARPRPVRSRALRSAARTAGHAVRRRLDLRHAALHHAQPKLGEVRRHGRGDRLRPAPTASSADRSTRHAERARRRHRRAAHRRLLRRAAGLHRFRVPGPRQRARTSTAVRRAARASRCSSSRPRISRSRRASSIRSSRPTAIRASTSTTCSAIRSRPRSRRWTRANAARSRRFDEGIDG